MGTLAAGQVVLVRFPFSDLTASKLRPAVVLADAGRDDWILCQITSKSYGDTRAISLEDGDFAVGSFATHQFRAPRQVIHGSCQPRGRTNRQLESWQVRWHS
jgi:mRNA interferase MazF